MKSATFRCEALCTHMVVLFLLSNVMQAKVMHYEMMFNCIGTKLRNQLELGVQLEC